MFWTLSLLSTNRSWVFGNAKTKLMTINETDNPMWKWNDPLGRSRRSSRVMLELSSFWVFGSHDFVYKIGNRFFLVKDPIDVPSALCMVYYFDFTSLDSVKFSQAAVMFYFIIQNSTFEFFNYSFHSRWNVPIITTENWTHFTNPSLKSWQFFYCVKLYYV